MRTRILLALALAAAAPAGAAYYHTLEPCRAYDSRTAGGPLPGAQERTVPLRGVCGIPSNATGVVASVTVVGGTAGVPMDHGGLFSVWDAGATIPRDASNFPNGLTVVNWTAGLRSLTAGVNLSFTSTNQNVKVFAGYAPSNTPVHVVIDVFGYYR